MPFPKQGMLALMQSSNARLLVLLRKVDPETRADIFEAVKTSQAYLQRAITLAQEER